MIQLDIKVDQVLPPLPGPIEQFAARIATAVSCTPAIIPKLSFGRAERISNGLLEIGGDPSRSSPGLQPIQRIRAIEHSGKPLLVFRYDADRLTETLFPGGRSERYLYNGDGTIASVLWCDTPSAHFAYDRQAGITSVRYSDGACFRFHLTEEGINDWWCYPDGGECVAHRDTNGRVESMTYGDVTLHYQWGRSRLTSIETRTRDGLRTVELRGRSLDVRFDEISSNTSGVRHVHSAIGRWAYDHNDLPSELISPFDGRLCRRVDERARTISQWALDGQTVWHFTRSGMLDSIVHADGTRTIFVESSVPGTTLGLSRSGAQVLRYEDDHLTACRSLDGSYVRLNYKAGTLASVETQDSTQHLTVSEGRLDGIAAPNAFRASGLASAYRVGAATIRFGWRYEDPFSVLGVISSWVWNWPDYEKRMRIKATPSNNS